MSWVQLSDYSSTETQIESFEQFQSVYASFKVDLDEQMRS